jgi:hypothetical protein
MLDVDPFGVVAPAALRRIRSANSPRSWILLDMLVSSPTAGRGISPVSALLGKQEVHNVAAVATERVKDPLAGHAVAEFRGAQAEVVGMLRSGSR